MFKKPHRILIVTLLLSALITVGAIGAVKFPDVGNYWATEAISWATERGIVSGYPDGNFKPAQNVKEAEFATILARFVTNTDKARIALRHPGIHWAQAVYDELMTYELPLSGYKDDVAKEVAISRGQVAQVVAAKNGFNLTEEQAVYYMYENDLSNGMIPGRLDFDSYKVDEPLQRDQITQFMKLLSEKGHTTFMGQPSVKGDAGPADMVGIKDIEQDPSIEVDFGDFKEKERELWPSKVPFAEEVAEKYGLRVDDSAYEQYGVFDLRDRDTGKVPVVYGLHENGRSFYVRVYGFNKYEDIAYDLIKATGKVDVDEVWANVEDHLYGSGGPKYLPITGGQTEMSGDDYDDSWLTIRIYIYEEE